MKRIPRAVYTVEYKVAAVQQVLSGKRVADVAPDLGVVEQTLHNWMKAYRAGKLASASGKQISPEQMENSRLRAEPARTRMELEIVKKSGGILREGITVRYAFIATEEAHYPREILCHAMAVSPSGFAAWRRGGPRRKRLTDVQLLTHIRALHQPVKGAYGSLRMFDEIKDAGHSVSRAHRTADA